MKEKQFDKLMEFFEREQVGLIDMEFSTLKNIQEVDKGWLFDKLEEEGI